LVQAGQEAGSPEEPQAGTELEVVMAIAIVKTEHNGAKRGKGFWGTKKEAKTGSRKARRANDKKVIRESVEG
jgi:hypothetical protein